MHDRLSLSDRPRLAHIPRLAGAGVTDLVTLQRQDEGGIERIGEAAQQAGLAWHWIPLDSRGGRMAPASHFVEASRRVQELLEDPGHTVHLHCAAGIHRTGMVAYGALRLMGWTENEALAWLVKVRPKIIESGSEKLATMERFLEWLTPCGRPSA